ncbi:MAG TPA: hypothetical protein VJI75_02390 [Candidatus Nanoarchaeia archaeon]|nr:hypothetical protein [Candidatus Nanoarchaeia archaeon]
MEGLCPESINENFFDVALQSMTGGIENGVYRSSGKKEGFRIEPVWENAVMQNERLKN